MSHPSNEEITISRLKIKWLIGVLLFFTLYATTRYIVFKGVDFANYPVFIVNKIFSIAGLFLIALSYMLTKINLIKFDSNGASVQFAKFTGLAGFSLTAMHVFLSLIILSPAYYPKFYAGAMMNLTGELSMLMGVLSLYCFTIPAIASIPFMEKAVGVKKWKKSQKIGYFGLLIALLHTTIMGWSGWLTIEKWPGYMPPISLLAAIIVAIPLYLKIKKRILH